jgi:hypothetical protein
MSSSLPHDDVPFRTEPGGRRFDATYRVVYSPATDQRAIKLDSR